MQTIVWNSQKGGSGKMSLCAHVSVEAQRAGDGPVYLIDTDPQGTLSTWHAARAAEAPHRVETSLGDLEPTLDTLAGRSTEFCFFDTAPNRTHHPALFHLLDLLFLPAPPN